MIEKVVQKLYQNGCTNIISQFKNQTKFLNDTRIKLTSKVDSLSTQSKMLENDQIYQVAQQVASSSTSSRIFSGQGLKINKSSDSVFPMQGFSELGSAITPRGALYSTLRYFPCPTMDKMIIKTDKKKRNLL